MAIGKVLAQLLVATGGTLLRAATQAYKQALANAHRSGVASEAAEQGQSVLRRREMPLDEARDILGVDLSDSLEHASQRRDALMHKNDRLSFYLQSKVYRAFERIQREHRSEPDTSRDEHHQQRAQSTQEEGPQRAERESVQ
jgi:import inner membrane translocase subunit TIM16